MPAGRPFKYSPQEIEIKSNEYFESCWEEVWQEVIDEDGKPTGEWKPVLDRNGNIRTRMLERPCITGLAMHLDTSRKVLMEYENSDNEELSNAIKKVKAKCEYYAEQGTISGSIPAGAGVFILKNYGWTDKQEIESNNTNTNLNKDVSGMSIDEIQAELKEKYGYNISKE